MLTLFTSGSTDEPKTVTHSWDYIRKCANKSINEIGLTQTDRVLDVFPSNTIAHYTITALPSFLSGAEYVCANFNPFTYTDIFNKVKPTYIALIPKHLELLMGSKGFKNLDMSSVRYMVTGSARIDQSFIDAFRERGVQTVANWYGMTEVPPPIMIGYNSPKFTIVDENIRFADDGECIVDGWATGDVFDRSSMTFSHRKKEVNGSTWKTNI